jgi:3-oxoacyl-[acyl-carrier protein] reductase
MNTLNNKVVVITGGCGQVGYTIAKRLASRGATVVAIVRRDLEDAQSKMKELSPKCYALLADVRDSISLMEAARRISHCDILINAAGYTRSIVPNKLQELTDEIFDDIIDTNLKGTFSTIRAFEPFIDSGIIINISSTAGLRASQSNLAYGAAKAGIDLITKSLAKALAPKIRVVGIAPGYLINPTSGAVKPAGANEHIANITPLKRVGEAEDIADTVESIIHIKHITGQTIVVDGGISL